MTLKQINPLLWLLGGSVPRTRKELLRLLDDTSNHTQQLSAGEISMLRNVLELPELKVEEVMIPYGKVDWLHDDDTFAEVLKKVSETNHSRYPVIDKDGQRVLGVLHVKLLVGLEAKPAELILAANSKLLQPARMVPESKRLDAMLREFQYYRLHMMVAADEAGHPSGVVTIEDVLEKIVGAIHDEFDTSEGFDALISPTGQPNNWNVAGEASLAEFNRTFGLTLDEERCDTVGGWIAHQLGRLPKLNETITEGDLRLRVTLLDQRRVLSLEVERLNSPTNGDAP